MKILIAAASFSSNLSGIQRHGFNLARCLLQCPEISALHLVVAPWQRELVEIAGLPSDPRLSVHVAAMDRTSLSRNLWYYRHLPRVAARLDADIVHVSYPMPVHRAAFSCPTVVTLHDLYPYEIPSNFGFPKFLFNRMVLQQCLRSVDAIACVSEATSHRLAQHTPAVWNKSVRIYNCVEPSSPDEPAEPFPGWQGEPFLLSVAQHRRNKNIPLLIRSFDRLLRLGGVNPALRLVVVGISGPETPRIRRLISERALQGKVHLLEGLSEAQLCWCYAKCQVLVAPSITEGFGLPVAEGLLAGCRVVCSDIPAHREVGDGHCRFVDLRKNAEAALTEAIFRTMHRPAAAPVPFPQLSAHVLAEQYIGLYRGLATSSPLRQRAAYASPLNSATSERQSL